MRSRRRLGWLCALLVTACSGAVGSPGAGKENMFGGTPGPSGAPGPGQTPPGSTSQPAPVAGACASSAPLPRRLRRLTNREYQNVITGWLGSGTWQDGLPQETAGRSVIVDAATLIVGDVQFDGYANAAKVITGNPGFDRVAACPSGEADAACVERFVQRSVRRLFGRPPTADELTRLRAVYDAGATDGGRPAGLRAIGRALLLSPHFLYVSELGEGNTGTTRLSAHETASQLSFLLTGSRPDDELLAAADAGKLSAPAERRRQAERLFRTPAARERVRTFVRDWFSLSHLPDLEKNARTVAEFTPALRASMEEELDRFIDEAVWNAGGTIGDLFTSSTSFVDGRLASLVYRTEVKGVSGDAFTSVKLDPARRRGVLSLPAFLAGHSGPNLTSPVERGLAVRRGLLCQPVPAPPPGVTDQSVSTDEGQRTTRQKFERHLNDASCRACHEAFDPIGFGMEQMDVIGRLRQEENGLPVDSRGRLSGSDVDGPFAGPAELSARLATSEIARGCFVERLLRLAEAREAPPDPCHTKRVRAKVAAQGDRIVETFLAVVETEEFVVRRSEP